MTRRGTPGLRLQHHVALHSYTRPMRLSRFLAAFVPLALVGCLGTTEPFKYATVEETTFATSLGVDLANSTRTTNGVYYRDVTVGTGATITPTDSVGLNYVGHVSDGAPFDSVTVGAPNSPFRVRLGGQHLILGLEEGLIGMQVGGRRQILIPPNLAYPNGAANNDGVVLIPPNAVIVFTVDAAAIY